jgi:phenylalanyl-tRNA synthetase beta chain
LEWVHPNKSTEEICEQLTNLGLEVDFFEPVAADFSGIVTAEIIATEQHPDADKLKICTVNAGDETLQIVCGGKNARAGIKVSLAKVGAVLPGDFKIKKAKLRGIESFGMLCSETELGIADTSTGILELPANAPIGIDIRDYLKLNDDIIDIDLTPDRGDCLSIKGIARELGVTNQQKVTQPELKDVPASIAEKIQIEVEAAEACPRYCTRVIKDVDATKASPFWLTEKLRRSGIRSINPIVDVINYVMLELGEPMHAFDMSQVHAPIIVRMAKADEKITLLDDSIVTLKDDTLLITDSKNALAIAGIMGGKNSGVEITTTDIILESAFFNPLTIMGKARRYGIQTDSSHRFERGVDAYHTITAIQRATQLILEICGGQAGPVNEHVTETDLPTSNTITLRETQISRLLGFDIPSEQVEDILTRLDMQLKGEDGVWQVTTPRHRFDLTIEPDLIEEVARVYGFDKIPSIAPIDQLVMLEDSEQECSLTTLRQQLVERGFHETMTYSFIDEKIQNLLTPKVDNIYLDNPIASDLNVMRNNLWGNLVIAVANNQKHQQERVRLFEIGKTFEKRAETIYQPNIIAGVISGSRYPEQWNASKDKVDFYDLKADVEALLPQATFTPAEHSALHPGQSAQVFLGEKAVGWLGALHPRISQKLKISGPVMLFSLNIEKIVQIPVSQYQQVAKNPSIRRDLALIVEEKVTFRQAYDIVANSANDLLISINVFDVYRGIGVKPGYKSIALSLLWQDPEKTLVDDEVKGAMQNIIKSLETALGAELRE